MSSRLPARVEIRSLRLSIVLRVALVISLSCVCGFVDPVAGKCSVWIDGEMRRREATSEAEGDSGELSRVEASPGSTRPKMREKRLNCFELVTRVPVVALVRHDAQADD